MVALLIAIAFLGILGGVFSIELIAALLWGIVMAWAFLFLGRKYGVKN